MTSTSKPAPYWKSSERIDLAKALAIIVKGQNAYGKNHNLEDLLSYFQYKLENRFSTAQVIFAIDRYTDKNDDIPTPSRIIEILNPAPPKITQTAYIAAKKWQEDNNRYDKFTDQHDIVKAFEKQGKEDIEKFEIQNEQVKKIAGQTFRNVGSPLPKLDRIVE